MTRYHIEVNRGGTWTPVSNAKGVPYDWPSEERAQAAVRQLFGGLGDRVRVVEVKT